MCRGLYSTLDSSLRYSFWFCRRFSELFRYHKYETDSVDLKAFIDVIKRMKQLEVLFPGQGADEGSHDTTNTDLDGSFSNPTDAFQVVDTIWVSDNNPQGMGQGS